MTDTRLAVVNRDEWSLMLDQAKLLVPTGFLPESIKTAEQAAAIILKGREVAVPAMYALSNIAVIKGKPVAGAELLAALIYRDHGDAALVNTESTNERATYHYKRRGWREPRSFSFSMADARQAGITNNPTWSKYPAAMLRARAVSAIARMAFPDSIGGMYTPEEMGAVVDVDAEGAFTIRDSAAPTTSAGSDPRWAAPPEAEPVEQPTEGAYREVTPPPTPTRSNAPHGIVTESRAKQVSALAVEAGLSGDALRKVVDAEGITLTRWSALTNQDADRLARRFQSIIVTGTPEPGAQPEPAPREFDFDGAEAAVFGGDPE